jgi:hypothetical protein
MGRWSYQVALEGSNRRYCSEQLAAGCIEQEVGWRFPFQDGSDRLARLWLWALPRRLKQQAGYDDCDQAGSGGDGGNFQAWADRLSDGVWQGRKLWSLSLFVPA